MPHTPSKEEIEAELASYGGPKCCEACEHAERIARIILDTAAKPRMAVEIAARVLGLVIGSITKPNDKSMERVMGHAGTIVGAFTRYASETDFR